MTAHHSTSRQARARVDPLDQLTSMFDAQVAKMKTAKSKKAVRALFTATPDELGQAAVRAAQAKAR